MPMADATMLDNVANDLAVWLDQTAEIVARGLAPMGTSPFSADLSITEKLEYYRAQLFNPDGTPNMQGRAAQLQRLGPQGFAQVYKALIKAYPALRVPAPPAGAEPPEAAPTQVAPPAPPEGVPLVSLPRGITGPTAAQIRNG